MLWLQVQEAIGCPLVDLFPDFPSAPQSIAFAASNSGFHLQGRATHVFTEAARVLRFRNLCTGNDSAEVKLIALGGLMRMSHDSCRDRYDCSCPELDDLVGCAKRAGALGSRLTGAGWGGATVHLMRDVDVRAPVSSLLPSPRRAVACTSITVVRRSLCLLFWSTYDVTVTLLRLVGGVWVVLVWSIDDVAPEATVSIHALAGMPTGAADH